MLIALTPLSLYLFFINNYRLGPYPAYGPPSQNLQVFYGVPHAMISIWDKVWEKIKWKLDLITLGKILLKLVIFKKIVSFIAIIFLLLFIPALKHKKGFFAEENSRQNRGVKYNMQGNVKYYLKSLHQYQPTILQLMIG